MAEMGIMKYYAPVLPRGMVFNTSEDLFNADLDVNKLIVQWEDKEEDMEEILSLIHIWNRAGVYRCSKQIL